MKLYFTLRSIPEFADLTSEEIRKKFRSFYLSSLNRLVNWIPVTMIAMSFVILEWYIRSGFEQFQGKPPSMWYGLLLRIVLLIFNGFFYRIIVYGIIASYAKKEGTADRISNECD